MYRLLRPFHNSAAGVLIAGVLISLGCGRSTPSAPAASPAAAASQAAPQIVAGKDAFFAMYKAAHDWSSDVVAMRLTQKELPGFRNEGGKAALWEAAFASPSLHQYRVVTDSIAGIPPNIYKGVDVGPAMTWGGFTRDAMPIDVTLFTVDSDAAYQAAAANATEWRKKNPGKDLAALEMGQTSKFSGPVWYVLWGTKASGFTAFVDATTGKVLPHK